MAQTRSMTRGNDRAQLSQLRESITSTNPLAAATLRNAVARNGRGPESDELTAGRQRNNIYPHKLEKLSNILANNINAAHDLRAITPYIDRAELIWSSLLLYPNGEQTDILRYDTKKSRHKSTAMHNALIKIWKDYYTNDYKIEDELRDMINDILWNTGSHITLSLSRVAIDYLINGMEVVNREGSEAFDPEKVYQASNGNMTYDVNKKGFRAINKGIYVASPVKEEVSTLSINGLESFLTRKQGANQPEFDILAGSKLAGTGFEITMTDNPVILASKYIEDKRKAFNQQNYAGNESFSSIIQTTVSNNQQRSIAEMEADDGKTNPEGKHAKGPKDPKAKTLNLDLSQLNSIQNELFPNRRASSQFVQFVKQDTDLGVENYGKPIEFNVPSTACIPIHINGNTKKKKDFILLIDPDTGEFLNSTQDYNFYQSPKSQDDKLRNKNQQGSTNSLIDNLRTLQEGKECQTDMTEFAELSSGIVIEQFMKSIISGRGGSISIELDEEVNKIFLSRMFRGQSIRCLYVPGECITYSAFKYSRLGLGQSLTQAAKMPIARLAALDLADAMANMEMAQNTNKMRVVIDKDDPTPEITIAMAREVFFRANPRFYNVLASSQMSIPVLVDAFKELSLTMEIDASDNPHLPVPSVEISPMEKQTFRRVDPESRNEVLNKIANYFMLPKGWLDVADENNNFQIEALTEHRLVYNQTINWQLLLCKTVMEREIKHVKGNRPLLTTLIQCINDNKAHWQADSKEDIPGKTDAEKIETILEDFLNNLFCNLPVPAAMEKAAKIKEGLAATKELVDQWYESSGKSALMAKAMEALNVTGMYQDTDMEGMIKAYLYTRAHKLLNIPSPFDEAVDDPTSGGIAGAVESIALQNAGVYKFISELVQRDLKDRTDIVKKSAPKIEKLMTKYQSVDNSDNPDENANEFGGGTPPDETGEQTTDENLDETKTTDAVTTDGNGEQTETETTTDENLDESGEPKVKEGGEEEVKPEPKVGDVATDESQVKDPF